MVLPNPNWKQNNPGTTPPPGPVAPQQWPPVPMDQARLSQSPQGDRRNSDRTLSHLARVKLETSYPGNPTPQMSLPNFCQIDNVLQYCWRANGTARFDGHKNIPNQPKSGPKPKCCLKTKTIRSESQCRRLWIRSPSGTVRQFLGGKLNRLNQSKTKTGREKAQRRNDLRINSPVIPINQIAQPRLVYPNYNKN